MPKRRKPPRVVLDSINGRGTTPEDDLVLIGLEGPKCDKKILPQVSPTLRHRSAHGSPCDECRPPQLFVLGTSPKEALHGLLEMSPEAGRHPEDRHVVDGYSGQDCLQKNQVTPAR